MNLHTEGRILYLSMTDVSLPKGPGVNEREFMLGLTQNLAGRVHVLIPRPRLPCPDIDPALTTYYPNARWRAVEFLWQQWQLKRTLQRLLATSSFDLVVVRLSALPLAMYGLRNLNVPYAIKTLGDVHRFGNCRGAKAMAVPVVRPVNSHMVKDIVRRAVSVDSCTENLVRKHRKEFGVPADKIFLVENSTNVHRFAPQDTPAARSRLGLERFDPILGYVGGYPAERGGLQILETARRMIPDYPNLGVVIVGDDGDNRLRNHAIKSGLDDRTVLPGVVPYDLVSRYVNCFDVGFGLDRPERFLAAGNSYQKIRQYLACGKPIITCTTGDSFLVRERLAKNVMPDDLDTIEAETRRLIGLSDEVKQKNAKRAVTFARRHLSTESTLRQRLDRWNEQLQAARHHVRRAA